MNAMKLMDPLVDVVKMQFAQIPPAASAVNANKDSPEMPLSNV